MMREDTLYRRDVVPRLIAGRGDGLVVSGLGSATWDLAASGDHDANFYLWGAMGGAAAMGLGLAIAQPRRQVMVLTGDGEMLMGIGSLATLAAMAPRNLTVVVLDNSRYGETGMQKSHTALGADLAGIAAASGFGEVLRVRNFKDLDLFTEKLWRPGPVFFANIEIAADDPPRILPERDGAVLKNRFRTHLGVDEEPISGP